MIPGIRVEDLLKTNAESINVFLLNHYYDSS